MRLHYLALLVELVSLDVTTPEESRVPHPIVIYLRLAHLLVIGFGKRVEAIELLLEDALARQELHLHLVVVDA